MRYLQEEASPSCGASFRQGSILLMFLALLEETWRQRCEWTELFCHAHFRNFGRTVLDQIRDTLLFWLKPSWLTPFLFKPPLLSRVEVGCGVLFLLHSVRRRTMPRRGWLRAPDGWVQIIRGPRPPSMKWPSATEMRQSSNTVEKQGDGGVQRPQARGRWRQLPARVSPEVSHEAAQKRVAQLEGALKAFTPQGPR